MYDNTHFATEAEAWERLADEREAAVSLAFSAVNEGERNLSRLYERLSAATKQLETFRANRRASAPPETPA